MLNCNNRYNYYNGYINWFINTDVNEWAFKSHPAYNLILEHTGKEQGDEYLIEIQKRFSAIFNKHKYFLIDLCKTNDLYGNPYKCEFDNFTYCSPSNTRYILHAFLILSFMSECMLTTVDVIEIGGGYGGLCFFIHKLAGIFNITIKTYTMFDLPMPLLLQKKYLQKLNINNVNAVHLDNIQQLNKNSFLISNYAFSEISMDLQQKYTTQVLNPYTSHGFLTWNMIDIYEFVHNKHITKEPELPLTGENNFYVRFSPK